MNERNKKLYDDLHAILTRFYPHGRDFIMDEIEELIKQAEISSTFNVGYSLSLADNNLSTESAYKIKNYLLAKEQLEEMDKNFRTQALAFLKSSGQKSFEKDGVKVTFVEEGKGWSLDTKKLKEEYESVYNACRKQTIKKEHITVTLTEPKEVRDLEIIDNGKQ